MVGCSECHTDFCRSRLSAFTVKNGEFFTKICGGLEFRSYLVLQNIVHRDWTSFNLWDHSSVNSQKNSDNGYFIFTVNLNLWLKKNSCLCCHIQSLSEAYFGHLWTTETPEFGTRNQHSVFRVLVDAVNFKLHIIRIPFSHGMHYFLYQEPLLKNEFPLQSKRTQQ